MISHCFSLLPWHYRTILQSVTAISTHGLWWTRWLCFIPWLKVHAQLRMLIYRKYQFRLTVSEGLKIKLGGGGGGDDDCEKIIMMPWQSEKEKQDWQLKSPFSWVRSFSKVWTVRPEILTHGRWKESYSTIIWFIKYIIFDVNTKQTVSKYDTE